MPRRRKWLPHPMRGPVLLLCLCAAVWWVLTLWRSSDREPAGLQIPQSTAQGEMPHPTSPGGYCSAPFTGAEGRRPHKEARLRALALVIRHGDRSAIHQYANASGQPAAWRCSPPSHESMRREWLSISSAFTSRRVKDGKALERTFLPTTQADGVTCEPGQLTPKGFEQHVRLGRHLASAYGDFLGELAEQAANASPAASPPVYARSTDYSRTLLSAAGLLSGLLRRHPPLRPSAARPFSIVTEDDEGQDVRPRAHQKARVQQHAPPNTMRTVESWVHRSCMAWDWRRRPIERGAVTRRPSGKAAASRRPIWPLAKYVHGSLRTRPHGPTCDRPSVTAPSHACRPLGRPTRCLRASAMDCRRPAQLVVDVSIRPRSVRSGRMPTRSTAPVLVARRVASAPLSLRCCPSCVNCSPGCSELHAMRRAHDSTCSLGTTLLSHRC